MADGGFVQGFALNLALVATIGAQNAFILQQALLRRYLGAVVAVCCLVDTVLLSLGALGVGTILATETGLARAVGWAGVVFLLSYAACRLRSAVRPDADGPARRTAVAAIAGALAISLLNPQIYVDAFVLLGGIAAQLTPPARIDFALGALTASIVWFIGFAAAATRMAAWVRSHNFWRALDILASASMATIGLAIGWYQRTDVISLLARLGPD